MDSLFEISFVIFFLVLECYCLIWMCGCGCCFRWICVFISYKHARFLYLFSLMIFTFFFRLVCTYHAPSFSRDFFFFVVAFFKSLLLLFFSPHKWDVIYLEYFLVVVARIELFFSSYFCFASQLYCGGSGYIMTYFSFHTGNSQQLTATMYRFIPSQLLPSQSSISSSLYSQISMAVCSLFCVCLYLYFIWVLVLLLPFIPFQDLDYVTCFFK